MANTTVGAATPAELLAAEKASRPPRVGRRRGTKRHDGGVIANTLRERRRAVGLSLAAVGDKVGVHKLYLSQLERGLHCPTLRVAYKLAAFFGCPVEGLWPNAEGRSAAA